MQKAPSREKKDKFRRALPNSAPVQLPASDVSAVKYKDVEVLTAVDPPLDPKRSLPASTYVFTIETALEKYCGINDFPLQNLKEVTVLDAFSLDGSVDIVLTDLPYNVRREHSRTVAGYDRCSEWDRAEMIALCGHT